MIARQIADRIAQRVAKTAVIGALALGVAVPAVLPSSALAAPTRPPADAPDLTVSLSPSINPPPYTNGQLVTTVARVNNLGNVSAQGVRLRVTVGSGFRNVRLNGNEFDGSTCTAVKRGPNDTGVGFCTIPNIGPQQTKFLSFDAYVDGPTNKSITVELDPDNQISERNESNNINSHTYP